MATPQAAVDRLVEIMRRLRAPGGCPWDREQDLKSLRPYLIEECYEVLEELDRVAYGGPWRPLAEELGDLLFQIVFHAQLAHEQGEFDLADVANAIADKIERRHPHVFGDTKVQGSTQVLENWAKLKAQEREAKTGRKGSVLDGVPKDAPALQRAERLTEKASRIGFDWKELKQVRSKLDEELAELDRAIESGQKDALEHELGDVLFTLANLARHLNTPAEDAVRMANARFTRRFQQVEAKLEAKGVPFGTASLEELDALWNEVKAEERAAQAPAPEEVRITTPDGTCRAFVHRPAGAGPFPAVLFFMDGLGLRPALTAMAARLAASGYLVLQPDMYYRTPGYAPFDAKTVFNGGPELDRLRALVRGVSFADAMRDTGAFLDSLDGREDVKGQAHRAVGYCFGGGLAMTALGTFPTRVRAAASFHGARLCTDAPDSPHRLAPHMVGKLYVGVAGIDPGHGPEVSARLEAALTDAKVAYTLETYPQVGHGWCVSDTPVFDRPAAEAHFAALLRFFA